MPIFELTLDSLYRCMNEYSMVFYHREGLYTFGLSNFVFLWDQGSIKDTVLLRAHHDGTLLSLEGKEMYRISKNTMDLHNITMFDNVRCKVASGHVEIVEIVEDTHCFSYSQILFRVLGVRASLSDIERRIIDGRIAEKIGVVSCNSSNKYREETDSFFK